MFRTRFVSSGESRSKPVSVSRQCDSFASLSLLHSHFPALFRGSGLVSMSSSSSSPVIRQSTSAFAYSSQSSVQGCFITYIEPATTTCAEGLLLRRRQLDVIDCTQRRLVTAKKPCKITFCTPRPIRLLA